MRYQLGLLCLVFFCPAVAEPLRLFTEEFFPYNYTADNKVQGVNADLLRSHIPSRFWKNLPEGAIVPAMVRLRDLGDQIEVVVHPQSIIHSMVGYTDGSVIAQLGVPDMRTAIGYALTYPKRPALNVNRLDFAKLARLDFEAPDEARFPAIRLARTALERGGARRLQVRGGAAVCADCLRTRRRAGKGSWLARQCDCHWRRAGGDGGGQSRRARGRRTEPRLQHPLAARTATRRWLSHD